MKKHPALRLGGFAAADAAQGDFRNMYSRLGAIVRRAPVTVAAETTIREALLAMEHERVGSVVIVEPHSDKPLGMFTLHDLLRRVTLEANDLTRPICEAMSVGVIALQAEDVAYQAAAIMARDGIRHVAVTDSAGRLVGVISQNDLFNLQRTGVKQIGEDIRGAADVAALAASAAEVRGLVANMLAQGVGAEALAHIVSTLNDMLVRRVIELTRALHPVPEVQWCWIALGSEGRFEQTLSTDQDNGLIFRAPSEAETAALREEFLPFAQAVNRTLDLCGFPLCRGNIMAGNPQWCLSLAEWGNAFGDWIRKAEAEALLNAAIFFDFRPLYGDESLTDSLSGLMLRQASSARIFLRQMAHNALQCRPPLGLLRDFVFDDRQAYGPTIDLKTYGSRPFVDATRVLALANGSAANGTAQRLRAVAADTSFAADDLDAVLEAFHFVLRLRLRAQQREHQSAQLANRIDPAELNELERQMLKESFKQARKLQARLRLDFRL